MLAILLLPLVASAAEPDAWVKPAERLQSATVTVRVSSDAPATAEAAERPAGDVDSAEGVAAATEAPAVTICTGICVGKGLIATSVVAGSDSRIRLTLPGGKQIAAKLRVIDEFSGLTLLECDADPLSPLELATEAPAVGSGVMTASAWGVEKPVVSLGVVAGVERMVRGAMYPPLMQCDVRTTDTSSGAAVVNRDGKLVGIVVAIDSPESRRGLAYAVPVSHLQRLLRIAEAKEAGDDAKPNGAKREKGVLILKRQRPIVGMRLEGDEDAIFVRHLTAGGPAEKAGIKIGDRVVATEGVAIRSVYQAVLPSLHKQPGDTMRFRIEREGKLQTIEVVLGGGVELASAPRQLLSELIQPQLQIGRDPSGAYVTRSRPGHLAEVFAPAEPAGDDPPAATAAEKMALLEKALERYQRVIEMQQQQIQSLKTELDALRKPTK